MKLTKNSIFNIYLPLVLFLLAFVWKFLFINHRDICLDEPFTIFHAQSSLKEILLLPTQDEPNPPLFMVLLHFWIKLFGIGPLSVRSLPIVFNALTVPFLYLIGKRFFSVWTGVLASGLFIFSTLHFFFGADTRAYSMLSFAAAGSLYYFLSISKFPKKWIYVVGLFFANFLLIYSHYFGWFVVFVQFISSFLFIKEKESFKKIWIAFIATGISFLPMAKIFIDQFFASSKGTWITPPANTEFVNQLKWFINSAHGLRSVITVLLLGIAVALIRKTKIEHWREVLILLLWWIVPYSIMFFISEKIPMFTDRYVLFNSIGFYLFISASVFVMFRNLKFAVPVVCLFMLFVSGSKMETKTFAVREIKNSVQFMQSQVNQNSLVFIYPQWANLGMIYYFAPEIFKNVDNYYPILNEKKIFPLWGVEEARRNVQNHEHSQIIYYQDNASSNDPNNSILNFLDSTYIRKENINFPGGIIVTTFEKTQQ